MGMTAGLPVSRIINVQVNLAPTGAQFANINSALIVGDSDIIDTQTRIMSFGDIDEVAALFGTSAPEYAAAALFFAQAPQPTQLYIGRWAAAAVAGRLFGGALSIAEQALANFTAITSGGFKIVVDGAAAVNVAGLNFSAQSNLNGVASVINTALTSASAGATVSWDGTRFTFKSATTGAASTVAPLQAPTAGVDIKALLKGTVATDSRQVNGIAAESLLAGVTILGAGTTYWYGMTVAATATVADADHVAVAAYVQAASDKHIYGVTTAEATALDGTSSADIGSVLKAAGYTRSFVQYSNTLYAAASMLGRLITVDFTANNSTITLMFKQEPGITAETLTTAQAAVLDAKRYNYFVNYDNGTAIIQNGWMSGPAYIDEIFGLDWLANYVQTNLYNVLYTSTTKIPQTDAGVNQLVTSVADSCAQAVANGLVAPGTWTSGGFGSLVTGDYLSSGFYIYAAPLAVQAPADREARMSPTIQVAVKLAGAIQSVDAIINVNR